MDNKSLKTTLVAVILSAAAVLIVLFALVMPKVRENRQVDRGADGVVSPTAAIDSFESCVAAGNPVMESYPRQCAIGGRVFVESVVADVDAPLVGGDRDEHGCIGSAGYSWCDPKEKCLRVWEETCYADMAEEVT